jgi:twitching motility two-component system response regulator PilG
MKKILLVDDAKTELTIAQVYLTGLGAGFVVAGDGLEALDQMRKEKPGLVITDVRMPRMDGFELCAAIRADPGLADVPVVMLTSLDDGLSRHKGRLVGASAFLTKPVGIDALRSVVSRLLPEAPRSAGPRAKE